MKKKKGSKRRYVKKQSARTRTAGAGRRAASPYRPQPSDRLIGRHAPDFTLPDQDGNTVRLSSLKGRPVVLYFYPKDFTSGCTREACEFRDAWSTVRGTGTEVIGVSRDDTALHAKFAKEYRLPFRLLADTTAAVCRKYKVIGKKSLYGRSYIGIFRSTFLIDKTGTVRNVWRNVKVDGHVDAVIAVVKAL